MDILEINSFMCELEELELVNIDAGTFWGAVGGAFTVVGGVAGVVGGAALLMTPEPTGLTKIGGGAAIGVGVSAVIGGVATIANNV